ncbi:MAG: hypothetical protein ABIY56_00255, partial [Dokdonella sp.]
MCRLIQIALLSLALAGGPALASDPIEARVQEIERLAVTAHWRESNAKIDALTLSEAEFSPYQRARMD